MNDNHHERTPAGKLRARGAGMPFPGQPGPLNAITDVGGVEVGYCTLIEGDGPLVPGEGPVRTGVTAILPRGREGAADGVFSGYFSMNGNGSGRWFIIDAINGKPVKSLGAVKKALSRAEAKFEKKTKMRSYQSERKNLYKERYVQVKAHTNSKDGDLVDFTTTFPIDDAIECCRQ